MTLQSVQNVLHQHERLLIIESRTSAWYDTGYCMDASSTWFNPEPMFRKHYSRKIA